MEYIIDRYAFAPGQKVPELFKGDVLRILPTEPKRPGYVRLIRERIGKDFCRINFLGKYDDKTRKPARTGVLYHTDTNQAINYKTALSLQSSGSLVGKIDRVTAVHCLYWPEEAREWITRTRRHACPSKSVIKQVVRYGCDFVNTAHKLSPDRDKRNEWRSSFSKAELIIIRNWTPGQRVAYRALRLIFKSIESRMKETVLCTYYFKTLMLWKCEELPPEFWTNSHLVKAAHHLLKQMSDWLESRRCPNYFISSNNMMDHLDQTSVSADVRELRRRCYEEELRRVVEYCQADEDLFATTKYQAEVPSYLHPSYLIWHSITNGFDDYRDLCCAFRNS